MTEPWTDPFDIHASAFAAVNPPVRDAGEQVQPMRLTIRSPEDIVAAVPVVLGFEPRDSIVMLTFGGGDPFHARVDLPRPAQAEEVASLLLAPALRHRVRSVLFVAYADDGPAVRTVTRTLRGRFAEAGIPILEVLRVHAGRWFASERPGAPRHGVPFDVGHHRFRARAVTEGIVVHGSRDELANLISASPHELARTVAALADATPASPEEVAQIVESRLEDGRLTVAELARILLALDTSAGRDAALGTLSRTRATRQVRLWTDVVRRAPDQVAGSPSAILGVAAWLAGNGALAWCALDRCRAVDPANTLAALVDDLLTCAVPPRAWSSLVPG